MASEESEAVQMPPAPDHLTAESQALWRQVVQGMATHGGSGARPTRIIPPSPGRLALLTIALEARDRASQARQQIAKDGLTSKTTTTGAVHAHPLLRVEKDAQGLFQRCWTSLNLEWSSTIDGGNQSW